ncbi:hypothetical protein A2714_04565 [Candidatus Woesebacteria bacterium RIFCSPHIGHO2_01_FULL_38_9]|uniref:Uncharacterized protein n=2 Tax=Candidatus Woeseibacteriota TaxID=1752722 RepID=A0A1F7Y3L6_9BACT|nr:MAG: hypothetical protein A2714_04565 [Candidatus Woesebacteria bacterium RIFCSPHIGHO2_01_FULL_38_9]OGM60271.1 MAG: hypothetical protein A3A75_04135 [Candidatus Woesebacteria bacterium RIFCSPLOWO2_01_FULL_39_10]
MTRIDRDPFGRFANDEKLLAEALRSLEMPVGVRDFVVHPTSASHHPEPNPAISDTDIAGDSKIHPILK